MNGIKASVAFLLSLIALCRYALAANVIHMPISRSNLDLNVLRRNLDGNVLRRTTVSSDLFSNMTDGAGYLVEVNVGTPGQALSLIIDTGSSDTFVLAKIDDQCNDPVISYTYGACIGGTFDPSSSSTFATVAAGGFKIKYLDNAQSSGDYISDNFEIGDSLVSALQMGLALHSTIGVGIMGIGYQTDEAVAVQNRYPNLIDQLATQKLINLRAYSLYLDDQETASGFVLLGGIDTAKFIGALKVLQIQKNSQTNIIDSFIVLMTSLSINDKSGMSTWTSSSMSLPVVLDSGTTLTYLPPDLVNTIISQLGAVDDTDYSDLIFVDCDWRTTRPNDSISFGFGDSNGPLIQVPLSELIRTITGYYPDSPFMNTCDLGMRAADLSTYILGDTFLRSAYVVYDLDHNQIALAQTNFEATGSQVHEIPLGASGIPLLSGQASGTTQVPQSYFTTIKTSSSSRTPTHLDTTVTTEATLLTIYGSTAISVPFSSDPSSTRLSSTSMSNTGGGSIAMPAATENSISFSTQTTASAQTVTPTSSAATSKSSSARAVPAFQKEAVVALFASILIALMGGFWFLIL